MIAAPFTCVAAWTPLVNRLDIEPEAEVRAAMRTPTAQGLLVRGAGLWICEDGTNVLAIDRPAGAFAKAVCVRDLLQEAA